MTGAEYRLLKPGPIVPDELRGDVDLFEAHNLTRIATAVLSNSVRHGDYLRGMAGATEFRRGPGMLLAPVAAGQLSSLGFDIKPLPAELLEEGCQLEPGRFELPEADKGIPVVSTMNIPTISTSTMASQDTAGGRRDRKKDKKRKWAAEAGA